MFEALSSEGLCLRITIILGEVEQNPTGQSSALEERTERQVTAEEQGGLVAREAAQVDLPDHVGVASGLGCAKATEQPNKPAGGAFGQFMNEKRADR